MVDAVDRAIVDLLKQDGRMSCAEIARRLGYVAANTVANRIGRLVDTGVMKVTSVVDPPSVGYPLTAVVDVQTNEGNPVEIAQTLSNLDRVSYVAIVAGGSDLHLVVHVRDAEDLHSLLIETIRQVPGITRTETSLLLTHSFKDLHDWSIPAEACAEPG